MAFYALTASAADSLLGAATETDVFVLSAPGHLVGTDTIQGGGGSFIDMLRINSGLPVTLAAADFANTRGLERILIITAGGAFITLDNAMVASTDQPDFRVLGGVGGDTVYGGAVLATPLVLEGAGGNDLLQGGGGNDLLRPGAGADTMEGGAGADTIEIAIADFDANDRLDGGAGNDDVLVLTGGGVVSQSMSSNLKGIERIQAAAGSAVPIAVNVGAGLATSSGVLTVVGTSGDDTLNGTHATVALVLQGEAGNDRLTGGAFGDTLLGGSGLDILRGLAGNDVLDGGEGDDRLDGATGNDWLIGGAGNDTLLGGAGADTLDLGTGVDRADGGAGNDLYQVLAGDITSSDLIADESGTEDTLQVLDLFLTLTLSFVGVSISGALAGRIQGIERFLLGSGNDVFLPTNAIGDSADTDVVTVFGGAGNDRLDGSQVARLTAPMAFLFDGGDGADTLVAGRGADTLTAGAGNDRVFGGPGNDLFLMRSADLNAADTLDGETGTDTLRLLGDEALGPTAFAGLSGIEIIELADGGQAVTLPGAFADGLGFTMSTIRGGDGDDFVDVSAFASNRRVYVELGDGNDTLFGGAGNDTVVAGRGVDEIQVGGGINRVTFGEGELSGLDIVTATTATAFDTLFVGVADGRTLAQGVFAGVSGFDVFNLISAGTSAVRLPSTLISQSGQASVNVNVGGGGSMAVDGRAIASTFRLDGGTGNDTLFGGSGADTLVGNGGDDVHIGGVGGDRIFLGTSATTRDIALLRAVSDGTADINTTQNIAGADSVSGTEFEGNFIMVDRFGFGLPEETTWFLGAGDNISLNYSAARLQGVSIAADDFGSLAAVRTAVGARLTNNDPLQFEKIILVITGASNTRFGVYYFEDRDHNATVDSTDILRLLAVGTGAGPANTSPTNGFRLTSEFELL
ncbi:calcium-binding protein [Falsiroseomonas oryzae]|uniref:calcium-binding protein n=1 Tax=Falsiroseomonas oryzae TaxID=2766473 RepID=UPI0022EA88CF|nr:calcium-binding protein [Roseomonas sp. MO-31]